jgi:uncharacterized RDD family membrane protein YckC
MRTGFPTRFLLYVMDCAVLLVIVIFTYLVLLYHLGLLSRIDALGEILAVLRSPQAPLQLNLAANAPLVAVYLAYWLPEVFFSASPAKLLCGLRIRNGDAGPASSRQLITRFLIKHGSLFLGIPAGTLGVSVLFLPAMGLQLLFAFGSLLILSEERQHAYDMVLQTAVYPSDVAPPKTPQQPTPGRSDRFRPTRFRRSFK